MTLIDSSVWIEFLRGQKSQATAKLPGLMANTILVGDIIMLEVLQGARSDSHAAWLEERLRLFQIATLLNDKLTSLAAKNYRQLRSLGITIRKTPDLIIGTYCIAHGHHLLHDDRDFEPMATHLGLMTL